MQKTLTMKWTPGMELQLKEAYTAGHDTGQTVKNYLGWTDPEITARKISNKINAMIAKEELPRKSSKSGTTFQSFMKPTGS